MTKEQFDALVAWVNAQIALKIGEAFRRDCLYESIEAAQLLDNLREILQND